MLHMKHFPLAQENIAKLLKRQGYFFLYIGCQFFILKRHPFVRLLTVKIYFTLPEPAGAILNLISPR